MTYTIRKNRVVEVYSDGKFVKASVSERAAKKWIMQQYQPRYYVETKNGLVEVCKTVYDAHNGRKVIA